jgi:hypothetical protein
MIPWPWNVPSNFMRMQSTTLTTHTNTHWHQWLITWLMWSSNAKLELCTKKEKKIGNRVKK